MIKIEDFVLWLLITAIIAIAIWLLSGSPPESDALIAVALFVAASEILIWKNMFLIDKNVSISFIRLKNDINNRFNTIENKLDRILK